MMKTTLEIINGLPTDIDYFLKPSVETPDLKGVLIPVADLKALITERDELKEKLREADELIERADWVLSTLITMPVTKESRLDGDRVLMRIRHFRKSHCPECGAKVSGSHCQCKQVGV